MNLVLDSEAVSALIDTDQPAARRVRQALEAAHRTGRVVTVASVTLAEIYRGIGRSQALDALLARLGDGLLLRDTDRRLARLVGALLAGARAGSEHLADAHAVAVALEAGGGVVLTSDPQDLGRLAAPYGIVIIKPLR